MMQNTGKHKTLITAQAVAWKVFPPISYSNKVFLKAYA